MHPPEPRGPGGPPDPRELPAAHTGPGPTPGPPVPPAPPGGPPGAPPGPPPHLMFPHSPLMMPPGIPLPMGGVPPALLPGALALHHAAVAGAAAGAAAAAEEARMAQERSFANAGGHGAHDGGPPMPPGGPHGGLPERGSSRGAGSRGPPGKRHYGERTGGTWRRLPREERLNRMQMQQQQQRGRSDWRGGSSRDRSSGGSRWRGGGPPGEGLGAPMKRSRAALKGPRGPSGAPDGLSGASSDSELSLMSVASQDQDQQQRERERGGEQQEEEQQERRSLSVEVLQQHGGGPLASAEGIRGALTPMSSLSGSESDLSISAASASPEKGAPSGVGGPPPEGFGGPPEGFRGPPGLMGDGGVGRGELGSVCMQEEEEVRRSERRRRRSASNNNTTTTNNNSSSSSSNSRSSRRGGGQFLFDLWVPTTFHPGGREAAKVLLGVRGSMHKELQKAAGAHVQIYGKELKRNTNKHEYDAFRDNQPLHLVVSTDRHRNPNPSPQEQLQIVRRLQHMLECLVRDSWPATASFPPPSFYDKQQCLGPSTGPLVEVNPLDGSCRLRSDAPAAPTAAPAATAPTQQQQQQQQQPLGANQQQENRSLTELETGAGGTFRGPPHGNDAAATRGPLGGPPAPGTLQGAPLGAAAADTRSTDAATGTPNSFSHNAAAGGGAATAPAAAAAAAPTAPGLQQPLGIPQQQQLQQQLQQQMQQQQQQQNEDASGRTSPRAPWEQPENCLSPNTGHTGVRFQGDPLLLLDLPPSLCLLLLTLQAPLLGVIH
ncbi:hypothetical protein, conserved [Eimeria acervulina]|uniref:KH domain-containing protein n=1 Tax=Eimeria acervulina TaxID=5801 RepID=U6GFD0_EIMAC|nr:hypothetical protein, conserved [Eimeria acervulina]CDI78966.1 hypothetical protein, conserved [Eimeria acervulina]